MNDISPLDPRFGMGGNQPPEPVDDTAPEDKRIAELIDAATKWAAQYPVIEADHIAAACTDYLNQLDAQWEEFEKQRRAEKEPHDKAVKAVQAKWLPRLERIDICRRAIRPLHKAWLRLKEVRLKAEREAAERKAAEAQRIADQLAEQAAGGGPGTVTNMIGAAEAAVEAEKARKAVTQVPKRAQVRGQLGGRTHSLRTVWCAEIIEQDLCYRYFRDHADVKALLQRLANAAARAGARNPALPGCYIYSEEQ